MTSPAQPTNRLARESSPYLLLHASNPVDWYPWGAEAFERARREDKPIFLSVGYSTCYWCHVMERESFSNAAIAAQLNADFVAIKLDREERPDLDEIYMTATQLLTQQGGWPNSVFLTHDLKPFFAGTYFPPEDRYGRPGFPRLLSALTQAWRERRDELIEQAQAVAETIEQQLAGQLGTALPPETVIAAAQAHLARRFDPEWGGFGDAPKFPSPSNLWFLLDRARAGDGPAREMLTVTLERMARGGLQDQLAGGFHRYSTDGEWLVPHFEKMLYDNAELAALYAEVAHDQPQLDFARVARATLDFVLKELTGSHGGFLSAIDAETDGHEGAYYTWTTAELAQVLTPADLRLLGEIYGFDGRPNFEGARYVLHLPQSLAQRARARGLSPEALLAALEPGRAALAAARAQRARPLTDDKVLTDWNGLMIAACARVGQLLAEPRYVAAARAAARFVLTHLVAADGSLLHAWRAGHAHVPALLDDYAFLVRGLLALHEADGDETWLQSAVTLTAEQDRRLWDDDAGAYFNGGDDAHVLIRARSAHDGALPSGAGVAVINLLTLSARTGASTHSSRATRLLAAHAKAIEQFPLAHVSLLRGLARLPRGTQSAPLTTPAPGATPANTLDPSALVHVSACFEPDPGATWLRAEVRLEIAPGWHINAQPASLPFLVPTAVEAAHLRAASYPEGQPLRSALGSDPLRVYTGQVLIACELRADAAQEPLVVCFQPCDETRCLASTRVPVHPVARRS
jgi:hypothetical protein